VTLAEDFPLTEAPPATEPVWLEGLNAEQRAAVEHDGGPLMILAGAGTGKTRTLVCRLARLIAEGTAPERILLVTFSRRAAEEMIRRAGTLVDPAAAAQVHAGTFHAIAHRTLQHYGAVLGLAEGFSVLDQGDAAELMSLVRTDVADARPADGRRRRFPRADTLVSVYSRVVNSQTPLEQVLTATFPWCAEEGEGVSEVFKAYTARKQAGALLDFDDLLLYWRAAVADAQLGPVLAGLYDHILVDEYQDTNILQSDILRGLRRDDHRVTVVGDDAQAVYSFRAATVRNLLDFPVHFPGASTVTLEHNYRSTQPILDLANEVVAGMGEGFAKSLWSSNPPGARPELATCPSEAAQADAVCDVVLDHVEQGMRLRDQAVLFRSAHHSDLLELELRRRRIPFVKYGGLKFLEAAHVRDLVALLRVLDNPWDELAWHRVLLLLEGVGPTTSRRLLGDLGVRPRQDPPAGDDPLARFVGPDRPAIPRAEPGLTALIDALTACRGEGLDVGSQVDRLRIALDPLIRRRYDHPDVRLRDIDQLAHLAPAGASRSRMVADLTLDPPTSTGDFAGPPHLDDDYLILSTVHSAKGGEWRAVHVIHAADGMFPSDMATGSAEGIDEERRLFYVALTRAREQLHIYAPLRYHHASGHGWSDRHSFAQRTRFLPPTLDHLLAHRAVRDTAAGAAPAGPAMDVAGSVGAALQGLW
jgi:DNA helicase II / ATP-dependent DNA helicase PcrA